MHPCIQWDPSSQWDPSDPTSGDRGLLGVDRDEEDTAMEAVAAGAQEAAGSC